MSDLERDLGVTVTQRKRRWTFVYLAEHSGLDDAFLHNLEHGTKEPCLNTIDILAKSFDFEYL